MATVNVTSWAEFLEAVAVAGDTVECPEGALWDLTEADVIRTKIVIRCAVINGNGTTIKGQRFEIVGGEYEYGIENVNALEVNGLHWESIYVEANNTLMCHAFWQSGFSPSSALTMNRCKVSAECSGRNGINHFFGGTFHYFTSCAMNVSMLSGGNLISGNSIDAGYSKFCRYQIYTTNRSSSPFMYDLSPFNYCEKCELVINAPNATGIGFHLSGGTAKISGCVIRGTIGATQDYYASVPDYGNYWLTVISSTLGAKSSDEYVFGNGIIATDSQLRDAEYLASFEGYNHSVFPLGGGDEDWHTGDPEINGGYPYIPVMLDLPRLELRPVDQLPYITIFDIMTPQTGFDGNGLAILEPTACEVHEELNGAWTFNMEHPVDAEGKWQYIQLRNILKINGQLFTILSVETDWTNNSGKIRCSGEHIFYQMADSWIFPGDVISGVTGQGFLVALKARTESFGTTGTPLIYDFQGSSDITVPSDGQFLKDVGEGCTPIDALIGGDGMIDQVDSGSAELYRDNFTYSINERMENALDNAFDIRIGRDLQGINRTIDTTNFVSYMRGYDKYGNWFSISWNLTDFLQRSFPHHVIRSKNFDTEWYGAGWGWAPVAKKTTAFFKRNCKPIIGYEIDLEDVRNNPDFEMMSSERLKVGDQGTLYDDRLGGNLTIKISGTVYDAVHDKVTHITIGDRASFSAPAASTVDVEPEVVGGELYIQDADGSFIADADDKLIYQEVTSDA